MQQAKGLNPEAAGLILIAQPVAQAIFSPFAGRLSDKIELRYMPNIEFKIDRSWQHARKVQDLLDKIEKERHSNDAGSDRGDKEA